MKTPLFAMLIVLLHTILPVQAVGLPDTGQTLCYDNNAVADVGVAADGGTFPRQDCRYGRDPAAAAGVGTKIGAGAAGFDYTKIANDGSALAASVALGTATGAWACTRDNTTGLTWEVKTAGSGDLRYAGHTYTWWNTDNLFHSGSTGSNTCNGTLPIGLCNTKSYAAAVNAGAGLCGNNDWRLPNWRELSTLIHAGAWNPSINATYFPNTTASFFWSVSSYVPVPTAAWVVDFYDGVAIAFDKGTINSVRLVRGGQF